MDAFTPIQHEWQERLYGTAQKMYRSKQQYGEDERQRNVLDELEECSFVPNSNLPSHSHQDRPNKSRIKAANLLTDNAAYVKGASDTLALRKDMKYRTGLREDVAEILLTPAQKKQRRNQALDNFMKVEDVTQRLYQQKQRPKIQRRAFDQKNSKSAQKYTESSMVDYQNRNIQTSKKQKESSVQKKASNPNLTLESLDYRDRAISEKRLRRNQRCEEIAQKKPLNRQNHTDKKNPNQGE